MKTELLRLNTEPIIKMKSHGDMEILIPLPGGTYQVEWVHSYGSEVFNPSLDRFRDYANGRPHELSGRHKFLMGITLIGVCPAKCYECPFGRTVMAQQYANTPASELQFTKARPISPLELQSAFKYAKKVALEKGILQIDEPFSAGALLAGDPSYSHFTAELMEMVSNFPGCKGSRWSTIGAKKGPNVLAAMERGAKLANPNHRISIQVSLHSTRHTERVNHTGEETLFSMAEIKAASEKITEITTRRLALAFVLHDGSIIEPEVLKQEFSPKSNVISLRPIYSTSTKPMDPERQVNLYSQLRNDGWDVIYMPPNLTNGNNGNGNPIELDNMRSVRSFT